MSRLIDADELTSSLRFWQKLIKETYGINDEYYKCVENVIDNYIDDAPTVDAVPVVRCKDCKYWCATVTHGTLCDHYDTPDAFCSHGKRRTDNG